MLSSKEREKNIEIQVKSRMINVLDTLEQVESQHRVVVL
jgi:hypothetical protein